MVVHIFELPCWATDLTKGALRSSMMDHPVEYSYSEGGQHAVSAQSPRLVRSVEPIHGCRYGEVVEASVARTSIGENTNGDKAPARLPSSFHVYTSHSRASRTTAATHPATHRHAGTTFSTRTDRANASLSHFFLPAFGFCGTPPRMLHFRSPSQITSSAGSLQTCFLAARTSSSRSDSHSRYALTRRDDRSARK
jgi:hypothetical protein